MKINHQNQTIQIETLEEAEWLAEQIKSPAQVNEKLKQALLDYQQWSSDPEQAKKRKLNPD